MPLPVKRKTNLRNTHNFPSFLDIKDDAHQLGQSKDSIHTAFVGAVNKVLERNPLHLLVKDRLRILVPILFADNTKGTDFEPFVHEGSVVVILYPQKA